MDLNQAMRQFFNEKGEITLRPELTLAGLGEVLFQADAATGGADRHCIRFWDFTSSREGEARDFNRTEVNTRIKVVAARLQQVGSIGDRVAILANNSPEYLFGFLGSLYAGMVPVPLYDPTEPGHADHLTAVMGDAKPTIVLTNNTSATAVRRFFADTPGAERPRIIPSTPCLILAHRALLTHCSRRKDRPSLLLQRLLLLIFRHSCSTPRALPVPPQVLC